MIPGVLILQLHHSPFLWRTRPRRASVSQVTHSTRKTINMDAHPTSHPSPFLMSDALTTASIYISRLGLPQRVSTPKRTTTMQFPYLLVLLFDLCSDLLRVAGRFLTNSSSTLFWLTGVASQTRCQSRSQFDDSHHSNINVHPTSHNTNRLCVLHHRYGPPSPLKLRT